MKRSIAITMLALFWVGAAIAAGEGGAIPGADGLIRFDPPQPMGCVAVRVDVPAQQMLTGVRWWNGSAALTFPKILVASGSGMEPPTIAEAVVVALDVAGAANGWSTVAFSEPVASGSGTLFVIIEYPHDYAPVTGGPQLGVGWAQDIAPFTHFVTGDGESWIKVASQCRVLVEPVLADIDQGATLMRTLSRGIEPINAERVGMVVAPNPFNPETRVDLYLAAASSGTVRVLDVRGRLVAELHNGPLQAGHNTFQWAGTDSGGRPVASGVYSLLVETADQRHVQKVLLVK
jgi:hypothetical protein